MPWPDPDQQLAFRRVSQLFERQPVSWFEVALSSEPTADDRDQIVTFSQLVTVSWFEKSVV
jgi:hypothetical protein